MNLRLTQTEDVYDIVKIYDGSNHQSTQIEKLSGDLGSLGSFGISSTGNSLFVKFESNYDNSYYEIGMVFTGFLATIHYGNPYLNAK